MRATTLIATMVTTVFPVERAPRTRHPAAPMMATTYSPRWAALRRHLIASGDAMGWAGLAAAGGLGVYMLVATLIAWMGGMI